MPELDGGHILDSRIQLCMFYLYHGRVVHALVRIVTAYWTPHETASHLIPGDDHSSRALGRKKCIMQRVSTNRLRTCLYRWGHFSEKDFLGSVVPSQSATFAWCSKAKKKKAKAPRKHVVVTVRNFPGIEAKGHVLIVIWARFGYESIL